MSYLGPFAGMSDSLRKRICRDQVVVVQFEECLEESGVSATMWMLASESERKRHLFHGMKETCHFASLHNDGRALCPEITTTAMLKENGKAFVDFARSFVKATKAAVGTGDMYMLPSEWWSSAVNMPEPRPEDVQFIFTQLSFQRNEFIGTHISALFTCSLLMTCS